MMAHLGSGKVTLYPFVLLHFFFPQIGWSRARFGNPASGPFTGAEIEHRVFQGDVLKYVAKRSSHKPFSEKVDHHSCDDGCIDVISSFPFFLKQIARPQFPSW